MTSGISGGLSHLLQTKPTAAITTTINSNSASYPITTTTATATTASRCGLTADLAPSSGLAGAGSRLQTSLTHGSGTVLQQLLADMKEIEDTVDSLEIPARGRCKVYMAKFGYDPFKQSPNENPDAELAFNAGDYIMVFDDIDEDGYFVGELIDGRRGFVPSNWLERLTGEDLFEFQANVLYKHQHNKDDESESNSYPPEFYEAIVNDTLNHSNFQHLLLEPEDYHRMNDYVDLDDVNEVDDECLSDYERAEAEQMRRAVPPPQRLILERQLNKSILISWLHPQATKGTIVSYHIYVDGVHKSTVPCGDRTKALLEGVDSNVPHRISVRAIDVQGRYSNDAACTIVTGRQIPFAPACVKASHITSDSALISWLPCNSNFHHVVAVNSVEVQTVRPGVYKYLINGLSANTLYRVWVRAKPGKILSIDEKNPKKLESLTTYVDFKTMPKSLPDPPVNVQVEAGPQRQTLLVTWLPLTLNDFGISNGCPVTGYAVFAGHKKLADIDSPTGDHALLDLSDLESLHKKSVTVRTKSGENLSQDSMPCQIPDEYLKVPVSKAYDGHTQSLHNQSSRAHHASAGGHHHRHSSDTNIASGRHSPSRQTDRYGNPLNDPAKMHQSPNRQASRQSNSRYSTMAGARGRQMSRSLQNFESDLDSRRSSIPAIEITRETSGSDFLNHTESYSEEEFENSMRCRGLKGKPGSRMGARTRSRQPHSADGSHAINHQQLLNKTYQSGSLARLRRSLMASRDIRYFVALFDYDPSTMSPNPNAVSEELAFKEGSIIKVFGDKGPDGFYHGELDNHVGYVPCNVVSEIRDPNLLYSLQEKNRPKMMQHGNVQNIGQQIPNYNNQPPLPPRSDQQVHMQQQAMLEAQQQGGLKRMVALYDYDPQENSPNADTESEIPFKLGDIIYVYGKMDTDGFYMGEVERTKQKGLVPSNFLREDTLPTNGMKPATAMMMQPQQQTQPMFNQNFRPLAPLAHIDPFQQQQQSQARSLNPNQFGPPMQQALDGQNLQGNQVRPNVPIQPQQPLQSQVQHNINRPSSLSLSGPNLIQNQGPQMGMTTPRPPMMAANQMQIAQSLQQKQPMNPANIQQQNMGVVNQQQYNPQVPSDMSNQQGMMGNNQQHGGGVLSNLLSSGKQIIGAATTPRAPSQPGMFPQANINQQPMGLKMNNPMGMDNLQGQGQNLTSINRNPMMQMGQNPVTNPVDLNHQQLHNPYLMSDQMNQNPQQQQQHFGGINQNRGPMNQMGEEQGGNILNTVKNMFKL